MRAIVVRVVRAVLALGGAAALGWLWRSGLLSSLDLETVRGLVAGAGPWGPSAFVLAFGLLQPFGVSAHLFVLSAALAWRPGAAILAAWSGSMVSAVVAFVTARYLARDAIQGLVPPRLRRWDEALAQSGFQTVLVLRLLFWTTFVVQLMYGLSRVRWRDYLLATALGNLPLIVLEVLFADQVLAWLQSR